MKQDEFVNTFRSQLEASLKAKLLTMTDYERTKMVGLSAMIVRVYNELTASNAFAAQPAAPGKSQPGT